MESRDPRVKFLCDLEDGLLQRSPRKIDDRAPIMIKKENILNMTVDRAKLAHRTNGPST